MAAVYAAILVCPPSILTGTTRDDAEGRQTHRRDRAVNPRHASDLPAA
jgi:hypothetical protein